MFSDCVFEVVEHLHFLLLEFGDPAPRLIDPLLVIENLPLPHLFQLHLAELFVEELGLFETSLLLSDNFSLLELCRKLSLSNLISIFLKLRLAFSLQFSLLFEGYHLLISTFELICLLGLSCLLRKVKAFLELFLLTLLFHDPALEVTDLVRLDLLYTNSIISSLLYLFHKLLLFLCQIAHSLLNLSLVVFGLLELLFGDS